MSHEKAMEVVHPEDRQRVGEVVRRALATGEPYRVEFRMPLPDGSIRWVESCGESRSVSGRQVLNGLLQDITERKRAEIALRESQARLSSIIDTAADAIIVLDEKGMILIGEPRVIGYPRLQRGRSSRATHQRFDAADYNGLP